MITVQTINLGEQTFDMCGKALGRKYTTEDGGISDGLVTRLVNYGLKRFSEIGLDMTQYQISVEKFNDAGTFAYTVLFENNKGAQFQVHGIFINSGGWPFLDHGISLDAV